MIPTETEFKLFNCTEWYLSCKKWYLHKCYWTSNHDGLQRRRTLLIEVQRSSEVREQAVNADIVNPVAVLLMRVLMEVEMQIRVLVTKCVRVHLHHHHMLTMRP